MDKNFIEIINKGVPISTPVAILNNDLLELTDDKEKLAKRIDREFNKLMKYICETYIPKDSAVDIDFFKTMCIVSNPETLEKALHFSPTGFISSFLFNLNVNHICTNLNGNYGVNISLSDIDECLASIAERVDKLRTLLSENKLAKEFPFIYEKYLSTKELYQYVEKMEKMLSSPKLPKHKKLEILKQFSIELNKIGVTYDELVERKESFSLKSFCNDYADSFEILLTNLDPIIEYLESHPLDIANLHIDPEKLELYVAYQSLISSEIAPAEDKQRYIHYVANYFNSDKERKTNDTLAINIGKVDNPNVKIDTKGKNGIIVTPKNLYERYKRFLMNNPSIKVIDLNKIDFSGMNLEEVEMFIVEYLKDLQSNWEMIPPEELERNIDVVVPIREKKHMSAEELAEYQNHLMELYVEKLELYGSTDPFFRVRGKNTFAGYVGFIYSNGKVVLDKFFENDKTNKLAYGEAIYVMDISDFYILSQYPKSYLQKHPRVQRIEHRIDSKNNWKEQVKSIIESGEQSTSTAEEVKQLVKAQKLEEE